MNNEIKEQMTLGFQKLFSLIDVLTYSELEDMRREVNELQARVYNAQEKCKTDILTQNKNNGGK